MLTRDQLDSYRENGYLLVKGMFTRDEAAAFERETQAVINRIAAEDATWQSADNAAMGQKTALLHCHNVQFYSAALTKLLVDDRLTEAASGIIGPNVQLHHNKAFIKPPAKGSPFPMHQDHPFFPHERHSMIAAVVHFSDAPLERGCIRVVPGSYKQGPIQHQPEGSWHLPFDEYPVESSVPCEAEAGDVLFFSYLTIHGSAVNESDEARTTLLIQMRDPEDKPTIDTHRSRGQGMMLHGVDPSSERQPSMQSAPMSNGVAMGKM